jgi:rsbT antagonist protein RsbS
VAIIFVRDTLLCPLPAELTDSDVRTLRDEVGRVLRESSVLGVVIDLSAVDTVDSYITRCIRDVAVGARLMGAETVVCGVRVEVASTLVEMDLPLEGVRTARSLDHALSVLGALRAARTPSSTQR